MLDPTCLEKYCQDGWLVPAFRLPAAKVKALQEALEELIEQNPNVRPEKLVSAHLQGERSEGVRGHAAFLALAQDVDIVNLVSELIGPDVILWGCQVFCKPAGTGFETPWHQDGHYWPIRPLATCTVWVALEPSTQANGCLRVIPGSHRGQHLHPHLHEDRSDLTLNQRLAAGSFEQSQAVDIELQPGEMSLHDVFMIHGACANTSPQRRTGVALRYMPASSVFERNLNPVGGNSGLPVDFARRPIWLVKGADQTGRNDFVTGHAAGTRGD